MTAFADAYALIAWLNPRDADHARVTAYFDAFAGRLVTTEWVLVEVADAMSAPALRPLVVDFLREVRTNPVFDVIGFDPVIADAGFELFAARPDKGWSLTDCISFEVMTRRGLADALTADRHFEQAGFRAVFRA